MTDIAVKPEREIDIEDVGPASIKIKLPEGGGLTILCGDQGVGKSTSLAAVQRYLGADHVRLPVRDGKKRGMVESGFARLTISARTTLTGEVEISSLEGKFEIDALVDPKIANPERADAARIKALLRLRQVEPKPEMFAALLGSMKELEKHVSPESLASTDLVEMAAKIKRELDAAARKEEDQAEHAAGHARGAEQQVVGVDLEAPHDAPALTQAYESAVKQREAVKALAESAAEGQRKAEQARSSLEEATREPLPTIEAAETAARARETHLAEQLQYVAELRQRLANVESAAAEAKNDRDLSAQALESARRQQALLDGWRQTIEASQVEPPAPGLIAERELAVTEAAAAVETGVKVRAAIKAKIDAGQHKNESLRHKLAAESLRSAAKATDDVLSEHVQGAPLRVSAGRLVLNTDRGEEPYAELSEGERWKLAIDLAIEVAGPWALLVIPQEAFQGLSPDSKNAIHAHAKLRQVDVLGATVTRGGLRSEHYEPDTAGT